MTERIPLRRARTVLIILQQRMRSFEAGQTIAGLAWRFSTPDMAAEADTPRVNAKKAVAVARKILERIFNGIDKVCQ